MLAFEQLYTGGEQLDPEQYDFVREHVGSLEVGPTVERHRDRNRTLRVDAREPPSVTT